MPPQGRRLMRDDLRPSHIVQKKRKKAKRVMFFVLLVIVLLIGGLVYVLRLPSVRISSVEVVGNKVIDKDDVVEVVEKTISGMYLFVIPKNNLLIYPSRELLSELENAFPRAEYITTSLEGQKLIVEMKERGGRFLWCGDVPTDTPTEEECYFTDGRGYIFDRAPYFSDGVYLKIYGSRQSKDEHIVGSTLMDEQAFLKVVNLRAVLYDAGVQSTALYLKEDGDYEFHLAHSPDEGVTHPKILFSKNSDFATIANNLISALQNEPLKTDFKDKYSSLMYLDARFDNKVFFKFKEVSQ